MPAHRAPSPLPQAVHQLTTTLHQQARKLYQQELEFDARFDAAIVQYHQSRARFEQLQQECTQLCAKLAAQRQATSPPLRPATRQQEASRLLPATGTPELQYCIAATLNAFAQLRQL